MQGSGALWQPALMSGSERRGCHMGRINPPAFTAAHQGSTSLPVHTVKRIIPPGHDDEGIILVYTQTNSLSKVQWRLHCCSFYCSVFPHTQTYTMRGTTPSPSTDAAFWGVFSSKRQKDYRKISSTPSLQCCRKPHKGNIPGKLSKQY